MKLLHITKLYPIQDQDLIEACEMAEYEGQDDDIEANFNLEIDEDHVPSRPCHHYNLRCRQKRSISPARNVAPPPRTVPR